MAQPAHPALQGTVVPTYKTAESRFCPVAHFPDAEPIRVEKGRRRWYPNINTAAPCMLAVYEMIAAGLSDERLVWDVGCGIGAGTLILSARGHAVVGLDSDADAIAYARQFAPGQRFELYNPSAALLPEGKAASRHTAPAEAASPQTAPDLIVLVDVLSVADDPRLLLSQLRKCTAASTRLLIAEVRAHATQVLAPPAKRAFSERQLRALLTQAGFRFERSLALADGLTVLSALPDPSDDGSSYDAAARALAAGDLGLARSTLEQQLRHSKDPSQRTQLGLDIADICLGLGDGDATCAALTQVAAEDPEEPGTRAGMSRLTLALGNPEDALLLAVQAVDRDPVDPRAVIALAEAAEAAGSSEASSAWSMASALVPDDRGVLTNRARIAASSGHTTLAIAALEQLRTYHPEPDAALSLTLGWLLLEVGRTADAELEARIAGASGSDQEVEALLQEIHARAAQN